MRRLLDALFIALTTVTIAYGRALLVDPNQSGALAIGTSTAAPTPIFTNDPAATKSCIVNVSTNPVFVVGYSTFAPAGIGTNGAISTSLTAGSFMIPGSSTTWCFDGPTDSFTGPLWGVAATGGNTIQRYRTH